MKVQATYKGKTVEIDIPDEKLEELVKEQKKTGWEKLERSREYWYVTTSAGIDRSVEVGDVIDGWRYDCGNYFASKELAENIARYQSLDRRIRRRIAEICEPSDWFDCHSVKYDIVFDFDTMDFTTYCARNWHSAQWSCDTEEHAKQIIEEFKDELIWYFIEFKDRMDG